MFDEIFSGWGTPVAMPKPPRPPKAPRPITLTPQYLDRISPQLLPLSQDQTDPLQALAEWRCSLSPGSTIVYDSPVVCELCLEGSLLTHYLIENTQTAHSLWVGSTCIERPALAVFSVDGRQLDQEEVSAALKGEARRVQEEARLQRLIAVVRSGQALDEEDDDYWLQVEEKIVDSSGTLRPLRAAYLLGYLQRVGADLPRPKDLKIALRATVDQADLSWLQRTYVDSFNLVRAHLTREQAARFS
ncbi:MAG: hypothetical protein E6Q97_23805 [Desulfurellales bacterium]|nr:MAG: hypothetical protein E6Q97_23805 [Desulfurellales bacterium]